nr:hypothetical protein [Thecaphora frezii]
MRSTLLALTLFLSSLAWGVAAMPANIPISGATVLIKGAASKCTYLNTENIRQTRPIGQCSQHYGVGLTGKDELIWICESKDMHSYELCRICESRRGFFNYHDSISFVLDPYRHPIYFGHRSKSYHCQGLPNH